MCVAAIDEVRLRGDSCGGEVTCVIRGCPKGLGSPVFDKLEAELCKALMSLPASKVLHHHTDNMMLSPGSCCCTCLAKSANVLLYQLRLPSTFKMYVAAEGLFACRACCQGSYGRKPLSLAQCSGTHRINLSGSGLLWSGH